MANKSDSTADCFECRIVSSLGLGIAAAYIYRQARIQKTSFNRNGVLLISFGMNLSYKHVKMLVRRINSFFFTAFGLTSAARLFNLFPFKRKSDEIEVKNDEKVSSKIE